MFALFHSLNVLLFNFQLIQVPTWTRKNERHHYVHRFPRFGLSPATWFDKRKWRVVRMEISRYAHHHHHRRTQREGERKHRAAIIHTLIRRDLHATKKLRWQDFTLDVKVQSSHQNASSNEAKTIMRTCRSRSGAFLDWPTKADVWQISSTQFSRWKETHRRHLPRNIIIVFRLKEFRLQKIACCIWDDCSLVCSRSLARSLSLSFSEE